MIAGSMRPIWSVCISDSSSSVEQKQKQYDRELERAIVERTKSYKEWEYEIDQAKRNIFKKYVSKMDETHPFMIVCVQTKKRIKPFRFSRECH